MWFLSILYAPDEVTVLYGLNSHCHNSAVSYLADPPLVGSALDLHLSVRPCVRACVCNQLTKLLIYFVLDEISL